MKKYEIKIIYIKYYNLLVRLMNIIFNFIKNKI